MTCSSPIYRLLLALGTGFWLRPAAEETLEGLYACIHPPAALRSACFFLLTIRRGITCSSVCVVDVPGIIEIYLPNPRSHVFVFSSTYSLPGTGTWTHRHLVPPAVRTTVRVRYCCRYSCPAARAFLNRHDRRLIVLARLGFVA